MICAVCGTENRSDRRFCRSCGTALGMTCRVCGATNEPGDRFCGTCGAALEGGTPAGAMTVAPSPGQPTAGATPTTERRLVSVLFVDLVGSTTLAEGQDVEAVRELLGRYFDVAREIVARYGGAIEKFIGDAVMAVWGSPVAHEDDAERAVRAALDLVDAVAHLATPDGRPLEARAAVLTGEAAVALDAEGQGMVAGDLVNTASRLQSAAAPGWVLAGEATVRSSAAAIVYEAVGDQALKGKAAPVPAWRAIRVVAGRRGSGRATHLEAPFVGRDDELRLLKELLHQTARERRPRLVSITGIAGIGKSRLAWELEKYIDGLAEDVYWHQGRSPAYGDGLAFWALAEMVRRRAGIAETDEPGAARERLAAMAAEYMPDADERARVEPRLAALLGLGSAPPGGAEELTAAWRTLFERIADRGPTVLVFEDLHWADPGLLDFIEDLLTVARTRPILVLALARPELMESRPTWGAAVRNHLRLDLAPLDDEAMELLLLGLAPGIPPEAIEAIRERSEGVPLYAVETVRMLLDQGRLTESDGRFRLVGELGSVTVPESLQALLGSRLDALDDRTRDLVGHAAVLGISFTVESLAAATGRASDDVSAVLDRLVDRELLTFDDDPQSPERGQYRFLQGVQREVAYGRLSRRERLARHLAAAEHFASLGGDELAGVVATHWLEAVRNASDDAEREALAARARKALEAAAARSHDIGAYASAAGYLAAALDLADDDGQRLRLREARMRELYEAADSASVESEARDLIQIGHQRGDRGLQARAGYALAGSLLNVGRPAEAVDEVAAIHRELGPFATEDPDGLRLTAELARCQLMSGDPPTAAALIEATLPMAERLGQRETVAELLASKGWAIGAQGRPLEAIALLRGALDLAVRDGRFRAEMRARMNLSAWAAWEDVGAAFEMAREGIERAITRGYRAWAISLAGNACDMAIAIGDWDWAIATLERLGLDEATEPWALAQTGYFAGVLAYRGRLPEAYERLDRLREVVAPLHDPQLQSSLATVWCEVAVGAGDLDEADRQGRRSAELAADTGVTPDPAYGFVGLERRDPEAVRHLAIDRGMRFVDALLDGFDGGARVIDGDRTGLAAMDASAEILADGGIHWFAARLRRARAMAAPDDPGARAAATAAADVFRRLGAVTMLRGIENLVDLPSEASARAPEETAALG